MKAIDYYNTYGERVFDEAVKDEGTNVLSELTIAFIHETKELIGIRNAKTDKAAIGIIREQNEKWNALVTLFEKKKKASPIIRNGFRVLMEKMMPELKDIRF